MINIEIIAETTEGRDAKVLEIADAVAATFTKGMEARGAGIDAAIEYLRAQGFVITAST